VQKQCKPSAENLFFAEEQPVFANFCLQSYGNSFKITTFAPQLKQSLSFASCSSRSSGLQDRLWTRNNEQRRKRYGQY
jgi:hypothetical protein